jgi:gliding motility-associated lipoprotein GldD
MKIKFLIISLVLLLSSCSEDFSPKPLGYFRIELVENEYETFESNCSYAFSLSTQAQIINGKKECWYNIYYPNHDATIYLTYKTLDSNLASIIEESHKLAYDHSIKSDGIIEKVYLNEDAKVYGVLYDIHGNSASNLQFFVTDSSEHFLRGSLYFNTIPNADSLQPVKDYIKEDLQNLIESLKWS